MSGQLERCEREWHELEGEFQELQVGPGHLVPQLCYLRCGAYPHLPTPGPEVGRKDPEGGAGCASDGLVGGLALPLPIFQRFGSSASWGARSKPPFSRPLTRSLLHAPPSLQKVGLWPPGTSSRCVHEETDAQRTPDQPPCRGLRQPFCSPAALGSSTTLSVLAGQPSPAAAF